MSSSGFLMSDALAQALRKPYYQGDTNVTISYLVEGLKIGEYRVLLKRNFDTACWIPPVGSRGSHTIYYGDRMLMRIFTKYAKDISVEMPDDKVFLDQVVAKKIELKDFIEKKTGAAAKPSKAVLQQLKEASVKLKTPTKSMVMDLQIEWLKDNLSYSQWNALLDRLIVAVAAYGRHEREHARQTERDLRTLNKELASYKIPFQVFNLFEDARIEAHSRSELQTNFEWASFEDLAPMDHPINLMLRCIQLEGEADTEALENEAVWRKDASSELTVSTVAESVASYHSRACAAASSQALYSIMIEFMEEFKEELKEPPPDSEDDGEGDGESGSGSGSGSGTGSGKSKKKPYGGSDPDDDGSGSDVEERAGDLSTAAQAAEEGDSFFEGFEADADVVGGTDSEGKAADEKAKAEAKPDSGAKADAKGKGKGQGVADSIGPCASGGAAKEDAFLARLPGAIDATFQKRVDDLVGKMMRMFKSHTLPAAIETPGKRLSSRHLAKGELRYVHKRVFGGKGKRRYHVVYDCSGSMSGRPDREGKLFLLALNELARRGYLEGKLILSGFPCGRPGWISYDFPVKPETILRINPTHGSEGLDYALRENLRSLGEVDDVFIYTDACICDAPMDHGFYKSRKIYPVGLYAGDKEYTSEMERHFPQNIVRDNIEAVVDAMLIRNRRTVG